MSDRVTSVSSLPTPSVRSMTGQGSGRSENELGLVSVEIRSVNQRGLRIATRIAEPLTPLESRVEQLIRTRLKRGSLQVNVRFSATGANSAGTVNSTVVLSYAAQLHRIRESLMSNDPIDLAYLLQLPGAIETTERDGLDVEQAWALVEQATLAALESLDAMRATEGEAMAAQLQADSDQISVHLTQIVELAPAVVTQYRDRLENRISRLLEERGLQLGQAEIVREVQLFADRTDISEEITRLTSHLAMFAETLQGEESSGRKLDFIIQEMFRETNTIGSKANDAQIGGRVVEIKCAIERMRELVQNIE